MDWAGFLALFMSRETAELIVSVIDFVRVLAAFITVIGFVFGVVRWCLKKYVTHSLPITIAKRPVPPTQSAADELYAHKSKNAKKLFYAALPMGGILFLFALLDIYFSGFLIVTRTQSAYQASSQLINLALSIHFLNQARLARDRRSDIEWKLKHQPEGQALLLNARGSAPPAPAELNSYTMRDLIVIGDKNTVVQHCQRVLSLTGATLLSKNILAPNPMLKGRKGNDVIEIRINRFKGKKKRYEIEVQSLSQGPATIQDYERHIEYAEQLLTKIDS